MILETATDLHARARLILTLAVAMMLVRVAL